MFVWLLTIYIVVVCLSYLIAFIHICTHLSGNKNLHFFLGLDICNKNSTQGQIKTIKIIARSLFLYTFHNIFNHFLDNNVCQKYITKYSNSSFNQFCSYLPKWWTSATCFIFRLRYVHYRFNELRKKHNLVALCVK